MKSSHQKNNQPDSPASHSFFSKGAGEAFFSKKTVENSDSFFKSSGIQPSLEVGRPDDPYEKEADAVASEVVNGLHEKNNVQQQLSSMGLQQMRIQPLPVNKRISRKPQRAVVKEAFYLQKKCSHCNEEEKAQMKAGHIQFDGGGAAVSSEIETEIQNMKGGGNAMDEATKQNMESSFGADFSKVRVHTGSQAVQMSQQLNAHAFTVGSDIFFNKGRYQPQSKAGAGLLAHELAHTIQQGSVLQNKEMNSGSQDMLYRQLFGHEISLGNIKKEAEADRKKISKKGLGVQLQRCSETGPPVRVRYTSYGGTGFTPQSGGGSCAAYCACAENDAHGRPITAGQNRYTGYRPRNGNCPPGLEIVWQGNTITSETPLDTAPCTYGIGQTRSGCN